MGTITHDDATAQWQTVELDGTTYTAWVGRLRSDPEELHRMLWAWELTATSADGEAGVTVRGAARNDTISTPDHAEPLSALRSLASFYAAWAEARECGPEDAENADLFPAEAEAFYLAGDEFALDMTEDVAE